MKRLLEAVDKAQFAGEKVGQKPGDQWRGSDKKTPGKKLVGEENVFKELDSHLKENAIERKLKAQLAEFKQGVAEGSLDDIEDTRQFRNAIALAKSQKAIRHAKYGKDTKFYADGTPVTPEETARRAAERKARKQGVAEGWFDRFKDKTEPAEATPEMQQQALALLPKIKRAVELELFDEQLKGLQLLENIFQPLGRGFYKTQLGKLKFDVYVTVVNFIPVGDDAEDRKEKLKTLRSIDVFEFYLKNPQGVAEGNK